MVVSPVDQVFPEGAEDVNTTEPPEQNVVAPPGVIVGVAGGGLTVIVVPALVELQVPFETVTVYVPEVETVIDCVVALVDQVFPDAAEDVNTTEPPVQNVVGPPARITGTPGAGFTVTFVLDEVATHPEPLPTVTVYVPPVETTIDCVVSPVDHKYVVAAEDVNVTEPPAQNVVGPPGVTIGVAGALGPLNVCVNVLDEHPDATSK